MVAGMERYYQIARCYRDEDFRADRQPEFTQLDMEMSFVDADDVIAISEEVLKALWALIGYDLPTADAADQLRRRDAPVRLRQARPAVRTRTRRVHGVLLRHHLFGCSRRRTSVRSSCPVGRRSRGAHWTAGRSSPSSAGTSGLAYVLVAEDGSLGGPVAKNLTDAERDGLAAHVGAKPGDCIFFSAGPAKPSRALLGAARIEIAKRLDMIDPAAWAFTWVVDPPLFEPADEATAAGDVAVGSGAWTAVHHAFTSPKPRIGGRRSTPIPAASWPTPTTSCATATRSAAAQSVSTAATSRSGYSR